MASDMIEGELNVLTMSNDQIVNLISPTHLPAEEKFDAGSLFVVVKNILNRVTGIAYHVCWGQEHLEKPEEKVSRASFDPLLCTLLKQVSYEMACKAPGVEIAHKTTMSILDKLSSYSWNAKAVLTLAAFALDYEDIILALAQLRSSHQLVESVEHIRADMLLDLNNIIGDTLNIMESIFELKKLSTINKDINHDEPAYVYWIIITIVACIPHMCCLTSDEHLHDRVVKIKYFRDKTKDLTSYKTLVHLLSRMRICQLPIEEKKAGRKLKEFLQTPDEILEVFKELIFARNDVHPLIDGLTNEMVSIDVLKKKNVLLFISSLNISNDDISILMPIYDGIREKGDQYKIVWIPIVEQWTDDLRKKFAMLRSKMPWYIVQYFSPVAGIKFIKEEWYFGHMLRQVNFNSESKLPEISFQEIPIVVVMNPQGDVVNEDAFNMIRLGGMVDFPFSRIITSFRMITSPEGICMTPPGPYAIEEYTFLCGGNDNKWIKQFSKKVKVVAEDPVIKEAYISIELSCIGKSHKQQPFWKRTKTPKKTESEIGNQEIQKLLHSFKNESRWAVLTKWSTRVVSDHGTAILKVLEAFEEWKVNVPKKGFEICFKEYHEKFLQIGPLP